ncbi:hypothetical protein EZV62_005291 [Acer yangbiense]|uniref:Uncharacterized protein n=1 Tax=Acer yangbiense TaxID=1000413 RepID=A0A5C7IPF5_9ROSI|nr:hypothetical protein EZV62_005291 [Acer yangbiense]
MDHMTEILVSCVVKILLGKLGSLSYQQVFFVWGFKKDLQKLETILSSIKAVLLDAEEQQLHNHQVRVWLEQLKDVCYDAEYVLDEFEVEALRRQVIIKHGSIPKKVCNFLSRPKSLAFHFKLGQKIKEIIKRLDEIAASRVQLSIPDKDHPVEGGLPGHLRTIFFPFYDVKPSQSFVESCVSRFPCLRMLEIRNSNIELLPKKLGNLRHLRYLHLGENNKMKKLPNSICKLQSLQTLSLEGCKELQELPRDVRYLISLRTFFLTTNQKRLLENGIGRLDSLRFLQISSCGNIEYIFEDIGGLKALRILMIVECPSLLSLPSGVKYLSSLENLCLWKCEKLNLNQGMEMEEIKDSTRPQLRTLSIGGLPLLVELPEWLLRCSANSLQWLGMKDCPNFMALPESLQILESLQVVRILDCPKLSSLPQDMHRLTALVELGIQRCLALSQRCIKGRGEDWPKISHVPKIYLDGNWIQSK